MNRCLRLSMFLAALMLAPAGGVARPADLAGWRAARWHMTERELERAFGPTLARLPGRWEYGDAYATRAIEDVRLGGRRFRAIFQMNTRSDRLQQVLLEPRRRPGQEAAFFATLDELRAAYGPPGGSCATPRAGGGPLSVDLWWRFATTTVHLTFLDFYTRAMAFEDPNAERDPLTPYYKTRRNNPRFLPRKAVVRYHPTSRTDLMGKPCRPGGR